MTSVFTMVHYKAHYNFYCIDYFNKGELKYLFLSTIIEGVNTSAKKHNRTNDGRKKGLK